MSIKQLSVFLENETGRLTEVAGILRDIGVNITALSLAETTEYGILRLIVSDPEASVRALKAKSFSVSLTDVICVCTENKPGALLEVIKILSDADISIEYMYAFANGEKAPAIIRCDDYQSAMSVLKNSGIDLLHLSDL